MHRRSARAVRPEFLSLRQPAAEAGGAVFPRGDASVQPDRRTRLHPHPPGRALLQALWRLQPEPAAVPDRRGDAHQEHAADHRRGAAGVQQPAQARRRDRHARRHQRRAAGGRLRARLPAARVRAVRREPRREPPPLHRGAVADHAAAGGRERLLEGRVPQLPATSPRCRDRRKSRTRRSGSPPPTRRRPSPSPARTAAG